MPIDLRSDTVTRPTAAMRAAMHEAPVGDDVFGDDPTVNRLQDFAAEMLGKEAAIFAPSGTQANLMAILAHCQRGDEYIVGQQAHTYRMEGGGAAVLGSVQPQPLENQSDGSLRLDDIAGAIKPDDHHFARSRLLCLENTHNGIVVPAEYQRNAAELAGNWGLAVHLDGARAFNAAVASGVEIKAIAEPYDSVSICLSKGLGAPIGSVLVGSAKLIHEAHKWRKMLGGGMRQAGGLAAAGLYALNHHVERLQDDHDNARRLAEGLDALPHLSVPPAAVNTNMVFAELTDGDHERFTKHLASHDVVLRMHGTITRMVLHLDVSSSDVDHVIEAAATFEP